jgi:hypothetical protein
MNAVIPRPRIIYSALAGLAVVLFVACASAAPVEPTSGLTTILATKELGVGTQRVAFLLTSPKALITVPEVRVTSHHVSSGAGSGETRAATFHPWPYGVRGSYVTEMTFDRAGEWRLDIEVEQEEKPVVASVTLDVSDAGHVPQIGAVPPLSENKTLRTSASIEKVTTDYSPDPDLYQLTVAEAVASGLPTVVVFASPAFCTSPTCGPQTDTVSELKESYKGRANFIHVEIYDNPDEIQGDLSKAQISQPLTDWGISLIPDWFNESWTFILRDDGRIAQRFEGFATFDELKAALEPVLLPG